MPYFNNRRRARSQRSKQYLKSPNKRAVTYRNTLALESALSEQRLKNINGILTKSDNVFKSSPHGTQHWGIRMPLLQTADMIGAHTDIIGKLQITHLERWRRFKDRMTGPTDNTHWLLQGALREDGTSMNARILLGGYPWEC